MKVTEEFRNPTIQSPLKTTEGKKITEAKELNDFAEGLKGIADVAKRTNESIKALEQRSGQISSFLIAIKEIADQTNLLALNAAIEAARAGDAGKGFSVVAKEIRRLAESSKNSVDEIEQLVLSVQADTKNSVQFMDDMLTTVDLEKNRMKDAYESEKSLLDALLESAPDFIYFKDRDSKFIRNSMSHIKRFGCKDQEELSGKSDFDFHGEHARVAFEDEQKIMSTGVPIINLVQKVDLKNGQEKYLSTSKLPLKNKNGEVVGLFGISKDVTELKMKELELDEKSIALAKCMEQKSE